MVGNHQLEIRLNGGFHHEALAGFVLLFEKFGERFLLELLNGLSEDFLVHVEAQFRDKTALFATEEVTRTPDIEVAHGDLDAAAEVAELLNRLEAFAAFVWQ